MDLLWYLIVGLVAGWLAGKIMKGGFGVVGDLVVGVIGAMIGGPVFSWIGISGGGFIGSVIIATGGAILLVLLMRILKRA